VWNGLNCLLSGPICNKSEAVQLHAMQALRGEVCFYSFLTSAVDRGERPASRPGHALPSGTDPRYPLDKRLGGPQHWSGHRGSVDPDGHLDLVVSKRRNAITVLPFVLFCKLLIVSKGPFRLILSKLIIALSLCYLCT